ncbi:MAG: SDR family oxidoreductase [Sneathiellales bacterium]|nr:SDR family oxidoreductase [Sneathiellales bacterium]
MNLSGKTVLITGASSGIGRAAALLFARKGAQIIGAARRVNELQILQSEIQNTGGAIEVLAGDVTDPDYHRQLVELALTKFGKLDAAFNNAGIMGDVTPAHEATVANWHTVIETNLSSAFFAAKEQIPALLKSHAPSILFTSSFVGYSAGFPGMSAYSASKAGLVGLTKTLAAEYGAEGLRVNAILPGATATAMADEVAPDEESQAFIANLHGLKRRADPTEIARAALFLLSDEASFITGAALLTDGGVSVTKV